MALWGKYTGSVNKANQAKMNTDSAVSSAKNAIESQNESLSSANKALNDMNKNAGKAGSSQKKLGKDVKSRSKVMGKAMTSINSLSLEFDNAEIDVLGDAYEYMNGQFAAGAGKKAGEFYTPQEVSQILAEIVTTGKARLKNVYDPTCGSG